MRRLILDITGEDDENNFGDPFSELILSAGQNRGRDEDALLIRAAVGAAWAQIVARHRPRR